MSWPTEYGGRGATLVEQAIYNEEIVRAQAPSAANVLGLAMGGPTVIAHGSEEQKRRYLEPILSAEEIWCQGFSEPDSGSDLASVKTRAVRDGDDWLVTGQKVWTTLAHHAKWCMLVARTDPDAPKHQGLSYFLMDMEQDAVQVRPLRQITGEAEFNELFMEDARIPHDNIVGGEGNGWAVAITTLMHERATLAFGLQVAVKLALRQLMDGARKDAARAATRIVRDRLAQLYIESEVLRLNAYRGLTAIMRDGVPGPEGSLGKWQWAEVNQALTELAMDLRGPARRPRRRHLDLPLPARPRQLDRGRDDRDPQEHRGRARARPAADALMNFELTDDQRSIQRTARDFLAARIRRPRSAGWPTRPSAASPTTGWAAICELGWPALLVPEEHGGLGLGVVELAVVQEELGAALAPVAVPLDGGRRARSSPTPAATSSANAGCRRWPPARRAARSPRCVDDAAGPRCPTRRAPTWSWCARRRPGRLPARRARAPVEALDPTRRL